MSDWEQRMSERAGGRLASAWAEAEAMNAVYNDPPEPGEAEIRLALPPRPDPEHCAHGFRIGDNSDIAGMVFAAPFMICVCCERTLYYIDSGSYAFGGPESSISSRTDQHLCEGCGGRVRREVHGIPSQTITTSGSYRCTDGGEHEGVPGELTSEDPRISYRDVKACAKCGNTMKWTTVWFADLVDYNEFG